MGALSCYALCTLEPIMKSHFSTLRKIMEDGPDKEKTQDTLKKYERVEIHDNCLHCLNLELNFHSFAIHFPH